MSGLIICGFPGVGKSSVGGWWNCVDLESSYFSQRWDGEQSIIAKTREVIWGSSDADLELLKYPTWVEVYCTIGMSLAHQGFTVLMSTHKDVVSFLRQTCGGLVVIFSPTLEMKDQWLNRLYERYSKSGSAKDERAFRACNEDWEGKIADLETAGFLVYHPQSLDYDLKTYISMIRDSIQNVEERAGVL